jgi:hypothetical protein
MATWAEFESAAPEIAAAGKTLLYQFGVGLAYLATLRKDGAPRLHPVCPTVVGGRLYALIGPSHKRADLRRDGRYALHTFPCPKVDDEFLLMGRARFIEDHSVAEMVRSDLVARGIHVAVPHLVGQVGCVVSMQGPGRARVVVTGGFPQNSGILLAAVCGKCHSNT